LAHYLRSRTNDTSHTTCS